ncbi:MAG TPA: hypothetical protein PKA10_06100 [Selenomonadales bacterium]|nr:hypothetical protein [Selenomonadales bacterium]
MFSADREWSVRLARTLWFNTYRAQIGDSAGNYIATLRLIPTAPLDRAELPADAPDASAYVLVLVEDAVWAEDQLVEFESRVSGLLLEQMTQPDFAPAFCQFAYPSPPHVPLNWVD